MKKAYDLNRNDTETVYFLAYDLAAVGETDKLKELVLVAQRLSPKDLYLRALILFVDGHV